MAETNPNNRPSRGEKKKEYKKRISTKAENIEEELDKYIEKNENPYLVGFLLEYGICKSYFSHLINEKDDDGNFINEDLRALHDRLFMKRENFMVDGALNNRLNANFTKFLLKQKCFGYTENVVVKSEAEEDKNQTGIVEIPAIISNENEET